MRGLEDTLHRLLRDERGTASMEFAVMLPLLLAPLILTAEYGQALSERERLDSALADATSMLSQAPAMPGLTEADPPMIYTHFIEKARDMIEARLGHGAEVTGFAVSVSGDLGEGAFARPFYRLRVRASVTLDLRMLSFVSAFTGEAGGLQTELTVLAFDEARYAPAVPPIDNVDCGWDDLVACGEDILAATPPVAWADEPGSAALPMCLPDEPACSEP